MIRIAQNLANEVSKVQSVANALASQCADSKVSSPLRRHSRIPKNYAVQLKIIAAVKASNAKEEDAATGWQLNSAAQGLARAVADTLRAAHRLSLCSKSQSQSQSQ
jgi:hypothetical protein